MNKSVFKPSKGLYIDQDILDADLTWTARAFMARVRVLCSGGTSGKYNERHAKAAEALGINRGTAIRVIKQLKDTKANGVSLLEGDFKADGHLRALMSEKYYVANKQVYAENMYSTAIELASAQTIKQYSTEADVRKCNNLLFENATEVFENATTIVRKSNSGCSKIEQPSKENKIGVQVKEKTDGQDKQKVSQSFFQNKKPDTGDAAAGTVTAVLETETAEPDRILRSCTDPVGMFGLWSRQVCLITFPNVHVIPEKDGKPAVERQLPKPGNGSTSLAELVPLQTFAVKQWPDADPSLALQQVLRACAGTERSRLKLQISTSFGNGCLGVRAIMAIAGSDNPLGFVEERIQTVLEPCGNVHAEATAAEVAELMEACGVIPGSQYYAIYGDAAFESCWITAAAKRRAAGVSAHTYAFAALVHAGRGDVIGIPLPWILDSLTPADLAVVTASVVKDRRNAWMGGPERNGGDAIFSPNLYDVCAGSLNAAAAALLLDSHIPVDLAPAMRSRTCILCAADELEQMPELFDCVKRMTRGAVTGARTELKLTREELIVYMRELAAITVRDDIPNRNGSCGCELYEQRANSCITCRHGKKDNGAYDLYDVYSTCAVESDDANRRKYITCPTEAKIVARSVNGLIDLQLLIAGLNSKQALVVA